MVSLVKCPSCDKRCRVEDDSLGKQAKCKACGETFTLAVSADETAGGQGQTQASLLQGSATACPPDNHVASPQHSRWRFWGGTA